MNQLYFFRNSYLGKPQTVEDVATTMKTMLEVVNWHCRQLFCYHLEGFKQVPNAFKFLETWNKKGTWKICYYKNKTFSKNSIHREYIYKLRRLILFGWLVGWFYGISTFVGYLIPNLFYANRSISKKSF